MEGDDGQQQGRDEPDGGGLRHGRRHSEASSGRTTRAGSTSLPASPVKLKRRRSTRRQHSALSAGFLGSEFDSYMMIPKSYNEEIRVTEYGPKLEVSYDTSCVYEGSRQFKSEIEYEQGYATKRYESSLNLCPETREYVYRECVELSPRLRPRTYSETIYAFPKSVDTVYTTTLRHWDNYVETRYVTGVKLVPAARLKPPSPSAGKLTNGNHLAYRQTKSLDDDTLLRDCPPSSSSDVADDVADDAQQLRPDDS